VRCDAERGLGEAEVFQIHRVVKAPVATVRVDAWRGRARRCGYRVSCD
jgi:hypothetical protein